MKFSFIIVILFGIIFLVSGCASDEAETSAKIAGTKSPYSKELTNELKGSEIALEVRTNKKSYSLPVEEIILTIENTGKSTVGYGGALYLEKLEEGTWYQIPYRDLSFTDDERGIEPQSQITEEVLISDLDFQLQEGKYRIPKVFTHDSEIFVIAAEFEITD